MVVRVCIDAQHSPFVTSLTFPQGIAPGENIELYIGTWDIPENPPPKANTIVVDPLTKVVHVARKLDASGKRKAGTGGGGGGGGAGCGGDMTSATLSDGPAGRKKPFVPPKGENLHRSGSSSSSSSLSASSGPSGLNSVGGATGNCGRAGIAGGSSGGNAGAAGLTAKSGSGKNKCGECGQVFDSIKEISLHMQRHLVDKAPPDKATVVTLTHRPKDGSASSKATIKADPNCRTRVEVSLPLTAVESFLQTVLDQAQQLLLKHVRPRAGSTLEVRKTDSYKEGDVNRLIVLEALEQGNSFRERTIVPRQCLEMTPGQLAKYELFYTKSLYERGLLDGQKELDLNNKGRIQRPADNGTVIHKGEEDLQDEQRCLIREQKAEEQYKESEQCEEKQDAEVKDDENEDEDFDDDIDAEEASRSWQGDFTSSDDEAMLKSDRQRLPSEAFVGTQCPPQCPRCSRAFLDQDAFAMHVTHCRVQCSQPCAHCGLPFGSRLQRDRHMREAHGVANLWSCDHCEGTQFYTEKGRDLHMYKSHPTTLNDSEREALQAKYAQPCGMCDYVSWSKKMLQVHRRVEHFSTDWPLYCPACACGVSDRAALETHVQQRHADDSNWSICLVCLRAISRIGDGGSAPDVHCRLHAQATGETCSRCGKLFEDADRLASHQLRAHRHSFLGRAVCHCGVCDLPQRDYRHLVFHMATHHATKARPGCDLRTGSELPANGQNQITDDAEDPAVASKIGHGSKLSTFICHECNRAFEFESQLIAHQVCVHQGSNSVGYSCPFCAKLFTKQSYLALHLRGHVDERPYRCSYCSRQFSYLASLRGHVTMKHTRDFRFRCPVCDKGFVSRVKTLHHLVQGHHYSQAAAHMAVAEDASGAVATAEGELCVEDDTGSPREYHKNSEQGHQDMSACNTFQTAQDGGLLSTDSTTHIKDEVKNSSYYNDPTQNRYFNAGDSDTGAMPSRMVVHRRHLTNTDDGSAPADSHPRGQSEGEYLVLGLAPAASGSDENVILPTGASAAVCNYNYYAGLEHQGQNDTGGSGGVPVEPGLLHSDTPPTGSTGAERLECQLGQNDEVLYQLNHADGSHSLIRLEPGQQLVLEDENGVKQVIDYSDIVDSSAPSVTHYGGTMAEGPNPAPDGGDSHCSSGGRLDASSSSCPAASSQRHETYD